ncbi:MFS transporter [Salmonella enterica]|nr:MFS transporter [Salmonella enterica]
MPLLHFDEPQPKLTPAVDCWREDLPENHEPQRVPPQLRWLTTRNDIYLEIPRYSTEVSWWMMLPLSIIMVGLIIFIVISTILSGSHAAITFGSITVVAVSSLILFGLKMYFVAPRDQPLRLNRKRQKLYIYNYNRSRLPWLNWPVTISTYNWADVHGEISFSPTPGDRGYRLYGAICKPGTYNVVERFLLAKEWQEREQLNQIWSYLCLYMKNENNLPEPRNLGRPDFWRPRGTDKWPEDTEWESTTAP